jgi:hypothetical protein
MAGGVYDFELEQIQLKWPDVKIFLTSIYSSKNVFELYLVKGFIQKMLF